MKKKNKRHALVPSKIRLSRFNISVPFYMQKLTQGTHSNFIFKSPVFSLCFPCPMANIPCANLRGL